MENHVTRTRAIAPAGLAVLAALVVGVSSSAADGTTSSAAPAAQTQSVDRLPVLQTTPEERSPGADRDCPRDGSGGPGARG